MKLLKRIAGVVLGIVIFGYVAVIAWFMANEPGIVFHPTYTTRTIGLISDSLGISPKTIVLQTPDGEKLKGWEIPNTVGDTNNFWIVFFHGNAGNVSDMGYPQRYAGWAKKGINSICVDYRGYGESSGNPSEAGFYTDGKTIMDYLINQKKVPANQIVVYGFSLGSGTATEMATIYKTKGLILEGAFTSVPDVGAELYPFLPIEWMAKNKFDNKTKIAKINQPLLVFHAENDAQIPYAHGQKLFTLAKDPKKFVSLKGGHMDAQYLDREKMYQEIAIFVQQP